MTIFVWVILVLFVIEVSRKLAYLSNNKLPEYSKASLTWGIVLGNMIIIWACIILLRGIQ